MCPRGVKFPVARCNRNYVIEWQKIKRKSGKVSRKMEGAPLPASLACSSPCYVSDGLLWRGMHGDRLVMFARLSRGSLKVAQILVNRVPGCPKVVNLEPTVSN